MNAGHPANVDEEVEQNETGGVVGGGLGHGNSVDGEAVSGETVINVSGSRNERSGESASKEKQGTTVGNAASKEKQETTGRKKRNGKSRPKAETIRKIKEQFKKDMMDNHGVERYLEYYDIRMLKNNVRVI